MEDKIIYEIRENVVKINAMLESMAENTELKLKAMEDKMNFNKEMHIETQKVDSKRITNLEETNKWLWRAFASSIITTLTGLIIVIIRMTN